ncbi:MAG TPA: hypothetical protein VN181_07320 [Thermoanaerobaculia bacterium]|nr:hypothetical protein [Thermoanaerobaculia bacterium]
MHLEEELKRALRREAPAPGFADRVLRRIAETESSRSRPVWWRAVAASVALTALLSGYLVHEQVERRREGEHAREQVLLALRIAGEKVRYAQHEVHDIGK